mgnify:CR=1 FL=1
MQRQLADAYLQLSQIVLQKADENAAATALARARALMPKAPALTGGVNGAITQARKAELDKAEAALKAAEAKPPAKVIDPTAPSTVVALKITKIEELRRQLDDIATDVVNYQCDVVFQVPRRDDAPWLETLLAKRVSKRDADFALQLRLVLAGLDLAAARLRQHQQLAQTGAQHQCLGREQGLAVIKGAQRAIKQQAGGIHQRH